jgi:hypothetical protein
MDSLHRPRSGTRGIAVRDVQTLQLIAWRWCGCRLADLCVKHVFMTECRKFALLFSALNDMTFVSRFLKTGQPVRKLKWGDGQHDGHTGQLCTV